MNGVFGQTQIETTLFSPISRRIGEVSGVRVIEAAGSDAQLLVSFDGPGGAYVRRELDIPVLGRK